MLGDVFFRPETLLQELHSCLQDPVAVLESPQRKEQPKAVLLGLVEPRLLAWDFHDLWLRRMLLIPVPIDNAVPIDNIFVRFRWD